MAIGRNNNLNGYGRVHTCVSRWPFLARLFLVFVIAICLSACDMRPDVLSDIREKGYLLVLTRNAPTTYYEGRDGPDGFEYALTQDLARSLGVEARYQILDSINDVLTATEAGQGHLAAAGLTRTKVREEKHHFGPEYKVIQQQVVCHHKGPVPKDEQGLANVSLLIVGGTSYEERLRELQSVIPELTWNATNELGTEQVLEKVWRREVDCTIADSNIVSLNRRYFPELVIAFAISEEQSLAWVLPAGSEDLQDYLEKWFTDLGNSGRLDVLDHRFYGFIDLFDFVDLRAYRRRIDKRLPALRADFEAAAEKHGIPWTLLAAQAYQESHWNPRAKSPTGVRGIMMLTQRTAKSLGVTNRLDPKQSIEGGAKYLDKMMKRLPEEVEGEDRLWLGLAAYNVGMGHIWDARTLARALDKDPNSWHELRTVLPLLAQKKYYKDLKYGYARGPEPVRYVQRIRDYHDILVRHLERQTVAQD